MVRRGTLLPAKGPQGQLVVVTPHHYISGGQLLGDATASWPTWGPWIQASWMQGSHNGDANGHQGARTSQPMRW